MNTRKRKAPSISSSDNNKKQPSLPALDDALTLEELIYSEETALLFAHDYIHPDDLYEAYDVLCYHLSDQVQLDIIKDMIEGLAKLYKLPNIKKLFQHELLSGKNIVDRFIYIRNDNDYTFDVTVAEVRKLAKMLASSSLNELFKCGGITPQQIVKQFLECSETQFDFNAVTLSDGNKIALNKIYARDGAQLFAYAKSIDLNPAPISEVKLVK